MLYRGGMGQLTLAAPRRQVVAQVAGDAQFVGAWGDDHINDEGAIVLLEAYTAYWFGSSVQRIQNSAVCILHNRNTTEEVQRHDSACTACALDLAAWRFELWGAGGLVSRLGWSWW